MKPPLNKVRYRQVPYLSFQLWLNPLVINTYNKVKCLCTLNNNAQVNRKPQSIKIKNKISLGSVHVHTHE